MKVLALDLGDVWIGSAISDALRTIARPYKTIKVHELNQFLKNTILQECVSCIVVGYPKTLGGKESEQTKKIIAQKEELEKIFGQISWVLWDEKLSSTYAKKLKKIKTKEDKQQSHSIAAAFILQTYLDHLEFKASF